MDGSRFVDETPSLAQHALGPSNPTVIKSKFGETLWPIRDDAAISRCRRIAAIKRAASGAKAMVEDVEQLGPWMSGDARYRILVDAVIDYAIFMLDPGGIVTSWNSGAQRLKGYTEQEIVGEHFSRFYTDEDRLTGLPQRTLATAEQEGKFESEGWRIRKDRTRFWANVVIDPIRDHGRLIGFAKITRDFSERKAAEMALKESEEQFRFLVQSVTDYAIYMIDPTGRVSSWNSGAQRIKGYRPDEIIGEHFSRFYTEED
jgi:PAS domain S-box-containing protein